MGGSVRLCCVGVLAAACTLSGCILQPGGDVANAAMVVYTAGSTRDTASVRMPVEADEVYATLVRIAENEPGATILSKNDQAFLLEVDKDGDELIGQVTSLGSTESLLYLWVDARGSGRVGRELTASIAERVCEDLDVDYEWVSH
jgi:hypothetical protein